MWKKGAYFLFGAYVLISLCEWASRLAFDVDHSMLTYAWGVVQPALLFVYSMGEWARELVKMIRLQDGAESFAAVFFFVTRLLLGAFDFLWGFAGVPFLDFVPGVFSFRPEMNVPLAVLVAACGLAMAIVPAVVAHSLAHPAAAPAEPTEPTEHAESVQAPARRGRAKKE